jgi:hypothetical protein
VSPAKSSRAKDPAKTAAAKPPAKSSRAKAPAGRPGNESGPAPLGPEQLTLRARPEPPAEALAAIVAAAQLLWTRPGAASEAPHPAQDAWRFSGRWWAQPALVRRARPWARP